jgi:apolipoprotein N-acyltransferase
VVRSHRRAVPAPHGLIAVAGVIAVLFAAMIAPRGTDTGDRLTIAAVQGGGRQGTSALEVPASVVTERHLEATAGIDASEDLDLVLWPENVVRIRTVPFDGSEVAARITEHAARLGVPIAVGITEDADATGRGRPGQITNAQVVVTPDGEITSRYDKVRRVPFGEYVPLRRVLEALGAPVEQVRTDAVAGEGPAVIELPDGTVLATVISWEVFFPGRVREGILAGGEAIINPTNGASYTGTIVQTQQVASSRLRAIETGRWVVQAAPTGFSAFVSPDGEVIQRTAVSEQRVITAEVPLRTGHTWYTRVGDGPLIWILAVALATAHLLSRRQVSEIDDHGDGTVVDQLHAHVGPEPAGGNLGPQSL